MASDEDWGPTLKTATWTMTAVALNFMAVRLYSKLKRHKRLQPDDWVLIASWVSDADSTLQ